MKDLANILAEGDPTLKIVIGLVFAGIWVLAQLASALGKKKDKVRRPDADYPVSLPPEAPVPNPRHAPRQQPVPRQPPPRQQVPMPAPRPAPPPRQVKQRPETKQRQRAQATAMPPPLVRTPAPETTFQVPAASPIVAEAIGRKKTQSTGPSRAERLGAILRPRNLQKEFILTEVLQPPLSMREPR